MAKDDDRTAQPTDRTSRSVTLAAGGKLTLSLTVNLLNLGPGDRAFLFDLIDKLDAYEKAQDAASASA